MTAKLSSTPNSISYFNRERATANESRRGEAWGWGRLRAGGVPKRVRASARFGLLLLVMFSLGTAHVPPSSSAQAGALPLVTNMDNLPLSDQLTAPFPIRLTGDGDVFFNAGGTTVFHWDSTSGSRRRLLQAGDPYPGFPDSITDIVGNILQVNAAGHAAMVNSFIQRGRRNPNGVFVFDGTSFQKVAMRGEVAPGGQVFLGFGQLRINNSDQVAFTATFEPPALGGSGLFLGSPTTAPQKIATIGESAPGTRGTYGSFLLIGVSNTGQVAFLSNIAGGTTPRALFMGSPAGVRLVAAHGAPAPGAMSGTFNLLPGAANYMLSPNGDVAFVANIQNDMSGINRGLWIGTASGALRTLVVNTDPTDTSLGGTFGGGIGLFGMNNAGKVLFQSNPSGGAMSDYALFLKDLSRPAQLVFARGQKVPGGAETFGFTFQASLNDMGRVAFSAFLQGGSRAGWFLGSGTAPPMKIVLEGEATPSGGTFGLAGEPVRAEINNSDQVAFVADILGPNGVGAFLWTLGGGVRSIANTNDTLPEGANPVVRTFLPGASDDQLVFFAFKAGGRRAVFTKSLNADGSITRLVGEGDAAPGIGGALWFIAPNFGLINDSEEVAFRSFVIGGSVYPADGIFTYKPGVGLRKVVAAGDPAPGTAAGKFASDPAGSFMFTGAPPARINSRGQVAFIGFTNRSQNQLGIFIGSADRGVQKVAHTGDPSPLGGTFVNFASDPSLNDAGHVAFQSVSQVPSGVQIQALFLGSGIFSPAKIVAQGDPGPFGSTVSVIPIRLQLNNADEVAYVAGLTGGPSPEGVFLGTPGSPPRIVALVGDRAPGTRGGTFNDFREADVEINDMGQVAFWAAVAGSAATVGCFLGSAIEVPAARLVEGQALPGGGTAGIVIPGVNNFIGETFSLTDSGQMSVFVANISGIPRQVIVSPTGVLSEFITPDQPASGTGSRFGAVFSSVATNSAGQFFVSAVLVEGPAKYGIFWDGTPKP